jgi:hypothetical protein
MPTDLEQRREWLLRPAGWPQPGLVRPLRPAIRGHRDRGHAAGPSFPAPVTTTAGDHCAKFATACGHFQGDSPSSQLSFGTAARYSDPAVLRPSWPTINTPTSLRRLTVSRAVPTVRREAEVLMVLRKEVDPADRQAIDVPGVRAHGHACRCILGGRGAPAACQRGARQGGNCGQRDQCAPWSSSLGCTHRGIVPFLTSASMPLQGPGLRHLDASGGPSVPGGQEFCVMLPFPGSCP